MTTGVDEVETELDRALRETKDHVTKALESKGATWTGGASGAWFDKTLRKRFDNAIKGGSKWGSVRENVLARAVDMVVLAIAIAGSSKVVNEHHAEQAFTQLHCHPQLKEGWIVWCE